MTTPLNVLGTDLEPCSFDPITGYTRDGFCRTLPQDTGSHLLCAVVTQEFLEYSKDMGNDLITPIPQWQFPGLKPGDKWCLCLSRWLQAEKAGVAPPVDLKATHIKTLDFISLAVLEKYRLHPDS